MAREHVYRARTVWTGAGGGTTSSYESYSRDHQIFMEGRPALAGSADAVFRGDPARHSPEDLLLAALSACHLLEYLYLCSRAGVHVLSYADDATGMMAPLNGKVRFVEVFLQPQVVIAGGSSLDRALSLHDDAHAGCYIANSVAFPVRHEPTVSHAPA